MSTSTNHSTPEKATIVVIQGGWQTPQPYDALVKQLRSLGHPTFHPALPSCTDPDDPAFPSKTLIDDALAVRLELIRQVEYEGKSVVVVMHALGGLIGSEAVTEDLTRAHRKAKGLPGGVVHLYFFTAFILPVGDSIWTAFNGEHKDIDIRPDGRCALENGATTIYAELPEEEARLWESRLVLQSSQVLKTKLTRAAYRYVPSTYVVCENDKALAAKYQSMFGERANSKIDSWSVGNAPMLSQTVAFAEKISAVAQAAIED